MDKINVVHAFSGVDSQLMAEKRVWGDRVNLLATMEVDVDAIISCAAIHENEKFVKFLEKDFTPEQYEQAKEYLKDRNIGFDFDKGKSKIDRMKKEKLRQLFIASKLTKNLGDISLANRVKMSEDVDIFTYSSPCQSFSLSGKLEGLKGTSGLLLECEKFIEINKPKVLLLENVKNLVGKQFKPDFDNWCDILDKLGYNTYWEVLNAKQFGVAQNRQRVFALSIRKDVDCGYEFPEGFPLQTRLKDVLEEDIDPKYYLSDEIVARFKAKMPSIDSDIKIVGSTAPDFRSIGQRDECYSTDGIIGCLAATDYKQPKQIAIPELDCLGMLDIKGNECIRRVYNSDGLSPTLTTMAGGNRQPKILEEPKIIQVGNYMEDHPSFKNRNAGRVYDVKGLSPTLISHQTGGSNSVKILEEPIIVASRGRYNEYGVVEQNLEFNSDGVTNTLTTVQKDNYVAEPLLIKEATKKGYAEAYDGDSINLEQPNSQTRRGRVGTQIANTLMTSCAQGVVEGYRIRKLTPKECWNLMDFDADAFDKVRPYMSDSALYKQAGNSIVVACMEHIFNNLDIDKIKGGNIWNIESQLTSTKTKENIG